MKFTQTAIPDVVLIEPNVFEDERGWFMESFNEKCFHEGLEYFKLPIPGPFVQENHSCSWSGVLRGLHYQHAPYTQGKLVRVVRGVVWDVVVDIRPESTSFGKWVAEKLSDENRRLLWVPPGFAHGFYAVSNKVEMQYKCTAYYKPEAEACLLWNDPTLAIGWPLDRDPIISDKDRRGTSWEAAFVISGA